MKVRLLLDYKENRVPVEFIAFTAAVPQCTDEDSTNIYNKDWVNLVAVKFYK